MSQYNNEVVEDTKRQQGSEDLNTPVQGVKYSIGSKHSQIDCLRQLLTPTRKIRTATIKTVQSSKKLQVCGDVVDIK